MRAGLKALLVGVLALGLLAGCAGGEAGLDLGLGVDLDGGEPPPENENGSAAQSIGQTEILWLMVVLLALLTGAVLGQRKRR